jgi:alpha-galactosidase
MKKILQIALLFLFPLVGWCAPTRVVHSKAWTLIVNEGITLKYNGQIVANDIKADYEWNGNNISTDNYHKCRVKVSKVTTSLGRGKEVTIGYTDDNLPQLTQTFTLYPDYVLTRIFLTSKNEIRSRYMAPIVIKSTNLLADKSGWRALRVPFDNDAWVRYQQVPATGNDLRSYEVTAIYDNTSRDGLVVGAVTHDQWKNAVDLSNHGQALKAFSGVADELTRDHTTHGWVKGKSISSATFFIAPCDDWRDGMEMFADVNATLTPPRSWDKAAPVGWNSWGALQFKVNHDNAVETADFIAQNLQNRSLHNSDGLFYMGLDSGWNQLTEDELKDFCDHCVRQGQVPCVYWTPFADWGKDANRKVSGYDDLRYGDLWLYANGKPQELDGAYAMDPTHPAVKRMMEETAQLFRRCGFKYVKMDFMTHGRLEADHWWRADITTGTEAYNYGMNLLDSIFYDMYLNLSISPIFPAQYAQSRRIACDAWNKISDTEYTLNALSFGWWIDRIYQYNDADHVVMRDVTLGENRARITSSIITGIFILGDDFSLHGDSLAKARAQLLLTRPEINKIATGEAFRPLESDAETASSFVRKEKDGSVLLALFNYSDQPKTCPLPLSRIGIDASQLSDITELWTSTKLEPNSIVELPAKDARIIKLSLKPNS